MRMMRMRRETRIIQELGPNLSIAPCEGKGTAPLPFAHLGPPLPALEVQWIAGRKCCCLPALLLMLFRLRRLLLLIFELPVLSSKIGRRLTSRRCQAGEGNKEVQECSIRQVGCFIQRRNVVTSSLCIVLSCVKADVRVDVKTKTTQDESNKNCRRDLHLQGFGLVCFNAGLHNLKRLIRFSRATVW